jgi:hypothetical protein
MLENHSVTDELKDEPLSDLIEATQTMISTLVADIEAAAGGEA